MSKAIMAREGKTGEVDKGKWHLKKHLHTHGKKGRPWKGHCHLGFGVFAKGVLDYFQSPVKPHEEFFSYMVFRES